MKSVKLVLKKKEDSIYFQSRAKAQRRKGKRQNFRGSNQADFISPPNPPKLKVEQEAQQSRFMLLHTT